MGRQIMRRHKEILVWVDGGQAGWNALLESIRLARWTRGRVTAIAVVPPYEGDLNLVGVKDIRGAIMGPCQEVLNAAVEKAASLEAAIGVVCEQGEPHRKILDHAESTNPDLIVLGVKREASVVRLLMEGTVSGVAAESRCDVLVIPEGGSIGWETVLLVIDECEEATQWGDEAMRIAASYGAGVTLLGLLPGRGRPLIVPPPESEEDSASSLHARLTTLRSMAGRAGLQCESLLIRGGVGEVLGDVSKEHGVSLIILGPQGKKGFKWLLTGRSVESIVHRSWRPILILGHPGRARSHADGPAFMTKGGRLWS